jgi:hypothetical protein
MNINPWISQLVMAVFPMRCHVPQTDFNWHPPDGRLLELRLLPLTGIGKVRLTMGLGMVSPNVASTMSASGGEFN